MCRYLCRVIIQKFSRRTEKFYSTKSRKREQNFRGIAYAYDHFLRGFPSDGFSFLIGLHPLFQRFIWNYFRNFCLTFCMISWLFITFSKKIKLINTLNNVLQNKLMQFSLFLFFRIEDVYGSRCNNSSDISIFRQSTLFRGA